MPGHGQNKVLPHYLMEIFFLELIFFLHLPVMHMRPKAIPLATITVRKSVYGFFCFPVWVWRAVWCPFGPPELHYNFTIPQLNFATAIPL